MISEPQQPSQLLSNPVFLQELRTRMVRFATVQLSDVDQAEDTVQEALIAPYKGADRFGGRSAFKTWVMCSGCRNCGRQLQALRQLARGYTKGEGAAKNLPPDWPTDDSRPQ